MKRTFFYYTCVGITIITIVWAIDSSLVETQRQLDKKDSTWTEVIMKSVESKHDMQVKKLESELKSEKEKASRGEADKANLINRINSNLSGKLQGTGAIIVRICNQYNINPVLVAAIVKHETGNGTSQAVTQLNNVGGLMGSGGLMQFSSIEESYSFMIRLLKKDYIDYGLNSIDKIASRYCPVGAANDPQNSNVNWIPAVSKYYFEMGGK